jgi:UDP-3-O-[3-hydroxymyristoyl] glucosamine N-acyltransferase
MSDAIVLVGTGAIAQEIVDVFGRERFVGAYCDPAYAALARVDLAVYTSLASLRALASCYVIGLADPTDRLRLASELERHGLRAAPPLIADTARVSPSAQLGEGTVLAPGVQIGPRARVGGHNMLMHHTVFGHDAASGVQVVIGPGVHVAGDAVLGDCVVIRANATLAKGITVGDHALVAQSAACFRPVPAHATAIGNPARVVGMRAG